MFFYKFAKKDSQKDDVLRDSLTGAGAGTVAAFVTNPVSQISNMKSSHPEKYGGKKWYEVAKDLWNKPYNTNNAQRNLSKKLEALTQSLEIQKSLPSTPVSVIKDLENEIKSTAHTLAQLDPKKMKLRAFYSGFSSKALNNALFSAAMFGTVAYLKPIYDQLKNKKIKVKMVDK